MSEQDKDRERKLVEMQVECERAANAPARTTKAAELLAELERIKAAARAKEARRG